MWLECDFERDNTTSTLPPERAETHLATLLVSQPLCRACNTLLAKHDWEVTIQTRKIAEAASSF